MNQQQQVARPVDTVRNALQQMVPQFKMALPKHLTPERLLRVTMTAIQNTPKLLQCDRTSLFAAVMTSAQLGLEPDGVLGQAYLVPFKGKVQFIPGYKGLITLARNSGEVITIAAHEVCENDNFSYVYGLKEDLSHIPANGDRGEITHFYAYCQFRDGGHAFEVMTVDEVNKIRDASEGYKAFKDGKIRSTPWNDHYVQMGRKSAIRRLANYLPMSVQRATALDDAHDRGAFAAIDDYGDVVIDADTGEVTQNTDDGAETSGDAVKSKLDDMAGGPGAGSEGSAGEESEQKKRKQSKPKAKDAEKTTPAPDAEESDPGVSEGAPGSDADADADDDEDLFNQ